MSWTATTPLGRAIATHGVEPATDPPVETTRAAGSYRVRTRRLEHARDVLELARVIIERGWVRRSAYVAQQPERRLRSLLLAEPAPSPDDVRAACLVGAVIVSAQQIDARKDLLTNAGPAVDALWDAVCEHKGMPGPGAAGRAAPATVRVARIRELVRWNDSSARNQDEVLGLLDRAISHTIVSAVSESDGHARR